MFRKLRQLFTPRHTAKVAQQVVRNFFHIESLEERLVPAISFAPTSELQPTGLGPSAIVSSDFNDDGIADLATANLAADNVSVMLGNGTGGFGTAVNYDVGETPVAIIATDLDVDGNPDLVVANLDSASISVLKGNGDGTFDAAIELDVGASPVAIFPLVIFNDRRAGVVVANSDAMYFSYMFGNRDGSLTGPHSEYFFPSGYSDVVAGDFNNDGRMDFVFANGDYSNIDVVLRINPSYGMPDPLDWRSPMSTGVGPNPASLASGDFNGDGKQDIVAAIFSNNTVAVALGNGQGSFSSVTPYAVGSNPFDVVTGDFNADGKLDVAVADSGDGTVAILAGTGTGAFQSAVYLTAGAGPIALESGDFNDDGLPDLAVANVFDSNVQIFLNTSAAVPVDVTAPIAYPLSSTTITNDRAHAETLLLSVSYSDNVEIDPASIRTANIVVTGPGGRTLTVTSAAVQPSNDSKSMDVYYTVAVPGGWTDAERGTWTVKLLPNQVKDAANNAVAAKQLGTIDVAVDFTPPTVQSVSIANVTQSSAKGTSYSFQVTYADNVAISTESIRPDNVNITGTSGKSLAVASTTVSQQANGLRVTYNVAIPGGWSDAYNGDYSIRVGTSPATDTANNRIVPQELGSFSVLMETSPPVVQSVSLPPITQANVGETKYTFSITYADASGIDGSTLNANNVVMSSPSGQLATAAAIVDAPGNGSQRTVTYTVDIPNGWSNSNNGTYTVSIRAGVVKDTLGNAMAAQTAGTIPVSLAISPSAPKVQSVSAPNVTLAGDPLTTTYTFSVTYSDDTEIDAASIRASNVAIRSPGGGFLDCISATLASPGNGSPKTVTYVMNVPNGWNGSQNGTYSIKLVPNQVKDTSGNAAEGKTIATFNVALDTISPVIKSFNLPNVGQSDAKKTEYSFTVVYDDNLGIQTSSIDLNDVQVRRMDGTSVPLTLISAVVDSPTIGKTRTVTYTVSIPGGWNDSLNGSYLMSMNARGVVDTSNNQVYGSATFNVNMDTTPPSVQSVTANNVTQSNSGQASYSFKVTYADANGIGANSIDSANVMVTGPAGQQLTIVSSSIEFTYNGSPRTATYTVLVPNGWNSTYNGTYSISLRDNQVADIYGNKASTQALGSFSVSVAGSNASPVIASFNVPNVTQATDVNKSSYSFTVTFADDAGIDVDSISPSNFVITGPASRTLVITRAELGSPGDRSPKTITYTVDRPAIWQTGDNGTYSVKLLGNQVKDVNGNAVPAQTLATFSVLMDTAAPTIHTFSLPKVKKINAGQTTYRFSVEYNDADGIDASSIRPENVKVTGPAGVPLPIVGAFAFDGWATNYLGGMQGRTVDYEVYIPDGWSSADSGTYTVSLNAQQVQDGKGNYVLPRTLGTFTVDIPVEVPGAAQAPISFDTYALYPFSSSFTGLQSIDCNDDGHLDLVSRNASGDSWTAVYGDGNGAFGPPVALSTGGNAAPGQNEITADFNGDGKADIASGDYVNGRISVAFQDSAQFPTPLIFTATGPYRLAVGDLNGDGIADLLFATGYGSSLGVMLGSASAGIKSPTYFNVGGTAESIAIGDFNEDGKLDVAAPLANGAVTVLLNTTTGSFPAVAPTNIPDVSQADAGKSTYSFSVSYSSSIGINSNTISPSNVSVMSPNGATLMVTGATMSPTGNGLPRTVVYTVDIPGGWEDTDVGVYSIKLNANQVKDTSGKAIFAKSIGSFSVAMDTTAPAAALVIAPNVTNSNSGQTTYSFSVVFNDNSPVDISTIQSNCVTVTGPGGQLLAATEVSVNPASNSLHPTAVFTVAIPGGWNSTWNGNYSIALKAGQVRDVVGNISTAKALGQFTVGVEAAAPALSSFSLPNVAQTAAGIDSYSFQVVYSDDVAINASTIGVGNVSVTGPSGQALTVTGAALKAPGNGQSKTVTYTAAVPGGWNDALAGTYTVKVLGNQVKDTSGKAVAAKTLGSFTVDLTPPVIKSATVPAVTAANASQTTYSFTVSFTDNVLLNIGSVGVGNVSVTGPGGQALTVLSATPNAASNGSSRNVVYTVAVPGGWNAQPAGTYAVKLLDNQVKDTAGNAVAGATLGTLTIGSDTVAPTVASFSLPNVTQANSGQTSYSFSITFADNVAINATTIAPANVTVTGPGGTTLAVTGVSLNAPGNGQPRTATYTVAVPGGWDASDLGTYTVKLLGSQVKDTAGNVVAAKTLGTFTVDLTPPAVKSAVAKNVTGANAGQTSYSFTVSFTDNLLLNIASVNTSNVSVTGPGGAALTVLSATPNSASNGSSRTVTYTVAIPSGWKESDNGAYTIKLLPNQIKDTAGNSIVTQTITAFSVLIPPAIVSV